MTIEEAIKTSLEYETRVQNLYQEALEKAVDEKARRFFEVMAREEQCHVDYLEAKLKQWQQSGKVVAEDLATAIPPEEELKRRIGELQEHMDRKSPRVYGQEIELLERAVAMEKETFLFYSELVDKLDEEHQGLFARFLEIERGHVFIVMAELDSVTRSGYWFDFREFSLEVE
jgi:rubrerythrin